jgi:hypothetical protein
MPLNAKGQTILAAMVKQYGEEQGTKVFYASKNAGTIEGVDATDGLEHQPRDNGRWSLGSGGDKTKPPPDGKFKKDDVVGHRHHGIGEVTAVSSGGSVATVKYPAGYSATHSADDLSFVHRMGDAVALSDAGKIEVTDASRRTADGYLVASAKVARVGVQKYKGTEVGRPTMDSVILYRPEEEVFSRDAMHSMANKPVTFTHPSRMVDAKSWTKHAKGFSGNDVVRDGDFVRVPLMLTDAETIKAFEEGGARELSVGYTTDIEWTAGTTSSGEKYDGIQRAIRANHHALVPVARGGRDLTLGDAGMKCKNCGSYVADDDKTCPSCHVNLHDAQFTAEERKSLAKAGKAKPDGSYPIRNVADLKNAIHAWGRGGATASDRAWIIKRAKALGATSELPEDWTSKDAGEHGERKMTQIMVDGIPIEVADEKSAMILQQALARRKVRDQNGDDDDDDDTDQGGRPGKKADEEAEREKQERGYKDAIAAKDGEIAALRDQLKKASLTDAQQDAIIAQRTTVLDAAKPLLPSGWSPAGKSLAEISRAAVTNQMGDAAVKDMDDAAIAGAFRAYTDGKNKPSGYRMMADGMSRALHDSEHRHTNQVAANDASAAYDEMVKERGEAYKKPISIARN